MGNDVGVVWHTHYHDHGIDDGALQHPEGCIHTFERYLHLVVEEPHTDGLAEEHDDASYKRVYLERGAEHRGEPLLVALAQGESDVPLRGGGHGAVDEAEHRHDAAHHIIYTVVFHAEGVEHHSARIERDAHHEEHAEIEQQGVLRYSLVVVLAHKYLGHKESPQALQQALQPQQSSLRFISIIKMLLLYG